MRHDVNDVWDPWQVELFSQQKMFEEQALKIYREGNREALIEKLTDYTMEWGDKVVTQAWELGDLLWTRYDEQF